VVVLGGKWVVCIICISADKGKNANFLINFGWGRRLVKQEMHKIKSRATQKLKKNSLILILFY